MGTLLGATLSLVSDLSEDELWDLIGEATVDAYDEQEQLAGFAAVLEESLEVPFETVVLGVKVTVEGVTGTENSIVADCVRGRHR